MNETNHAELFFQPGISPTSINQFYESPARFWRYSSYNPQKVRKEATPAMIFGRLVHSLVLTPDVFDSEYVVAPTKTDDVLDTSDDLKQFITKHMAADQKIPSKASKQDLLQIVRLNWPDAPIWEDVMTRFKLTVGKRAVVTKDQFDMAKSMQDQMFANHAVRQLIGNGFSEEPYCWFPEQDRDADNLTDLPVLMKKCRMDYNRQGLVIEYKTDIYPEPNTFERTIGNNGYHRQLAWQYEASSRKYGEAPRGAVIIAQDKEIHDDIAIYAVDPMALAIGADENDQAFHAIRRRIATNDWKSYPQKMVSISLPHWYKKKIAA